MTQQPNQNYPQGWGQQDQQPQQWGQQDQQQWGQPAQQWGQQAAAPAAPPYGQQAQAGWGGAAGYGTASTGGGSGAVGKAWALYAAIVGAVIALASTFLDWGGLTVSGQGPLGDQKLWFTGFSLKASVGGKDVTPPGDQHPTRIWAVLMILGALVLIVFAVLVILKKTKLFGWLTLAGGVVIAGGVVGELIYLQGKFSDAKKAVAAGAFADGAKYSIGTHYGAYVGIAAAVIALVFAVLATLSIKEDGGAGSSAGAYGAYGTAAAYGQSAQAQAGWGQQAPQAGWGQQAPAGGQAGWGQQQQANPFDPASQPTQAVQQQYPPQPPQ